MKCPTCGAVNDPANRFCDQCGTRLQGSDAPAPTPAVVAEQPTAAALQCPSCQATVLPGEAFCDECGASLAGLSVDVANADAPTIYAPPPSQVTADAEGKPTCQICGFQYVPGDQFCEQCGAVLPASTPDAVPAATASDKNESEAPIFGLPSSDGTANAAPQVESIPIETPAIDSSVNESSKPEAVPDPKADAQATPTGASVVTPQSDAPVATEAPKEAETPVAAVEPTASPVSSSEEEVVVPVADTTPSTTPPAQAAQPSTDDQAAYEAERTRLQEEIARQEQLVAQFEQMQSTFGAAAPPAVSQGLDEARAALTRLQTELDSLQPPVPTVDPAEIARLEEEIARQEQLVAQFEQMQSTFGAAAPPAVSQGLDEARAALTRLQTELVALGGSTSSMAAPSTTAPEAAPSSPPMEAEPSLDTPVESSPAPVATTLPPASGAVPVEPVVQSPVTPEPVVSSTPPISPPPIQTAATPRLIVESSGQELVFPAGKNEIIIGREDPISGIFPEVDLTNHGGESGGVSRQHARMSFAYGQWTVTDLDSTNYTRVDGAKIDPNVPVPVQDGARLQFGRIVFSFKA